MILAYYANNPANILKTEKIKILLSGRLNFSHVFHSFSLTFVFFPHMLHHLTCFFSWFKLLITNQYVLLRILQLSTHRTSETRQKWLLLVVSRHTITATKVIIKERITHTCYHCLDARFWLNILAPIWPFIGVSCKLSACLSRKDGQGPPGTPRSGPNLSMTQHNESTAYELQKPHIDWPVMHWFLRCKQSDALIWWQ